MSLIDGEFLHRHLQRSQVLEGYRQRSQVCVLAAHKESIVAALLTQTGIQHLGPVKEVDYILTDSLLSFLNLLFGAFIFWFAINVFRFYQADKLQQ